MCSGAWKNGGSGTLRAPRSARALKQRCGVRKKRRAENQGSSSGGARLAVTGNGLDGQRATAIYSNVELVPLAHNLGCPKKIGI